MNPYSILMLCFSGALLLYALVLYITKDYNMIARHYAVNPKDKRKYAEKFAGIMAVVALAPALSALIGLFSTGWALAALPVLFAAAIWIGVKRMK